MNSGFDDDDYDNDGVDDDDDGVDDDDGDDDDVNDDDKRDSATCQYPQKKFFKKISFHLANQKILGTVGSDVSVVRFQVCAHPTVLAIDWPIERKPWESFGMVHSTAIP